MSTVVPMFKDGDDDGSQDDPQCCGNCRFFFPYRGNRGRCRLFPVPARTRADVWCGQWEEAEENASPPPRSVHRSILFTALYAVVAVYVVFIIYITIRVITS